MTLKLKHMQPVVLHNWLICSYCRTPSTERHHQSESESTKDLNCPLCFFPSPCSLPYFPTSDDNMSLKVLGLNWIPLWDKYLTLPTPSPWASVFSASSSSTEGVWRSSWQTKRVVWASSSDLRCGSDWWQLSSYLHPVQLAGFLKHKWKKHFPCYTMCGLFIFLLKDS